MTQDCRRHRTSEHWLVALLATVLACAATTLFAQDITIRTDNDRVRLSGRFVSFDGAFLQVETVHGLITLAYDADLCEGAMCPPAEGFVPTIRLSGAARMGDVLMPALIEAFGRGLGLTAEVDAGVADLVTIALVDGDAKPAAVFQLRRSSTDEGFADLIALEADVVIATREARPEEAERARQIGLGAITDPRQAHIIGFDALVPVVSPGLGLHDISMSDIARAFRGELRSWAEIGGVDLPIRLHLGPLQDGMTQFVIDKIVGGAPDDTATYHQNLADLAVAVEADTGSLGILPVSETGNAQPLGLADGCGFTAVAQTPMVKTLDYPLTQPLFLYLPDRLQTPLVQDFLAWLRGAEAQLVVRRAGFVDNGAVPIPLDAQGQRFASAITQAGDRIGLQELQQMVRSLAPLTRLSTSFRFLAADGTDLDAPSRSALLALAQAIRDGRYDGQSIVLVGFGPDVGSNVSLGDAHAVADALRAALGDWPAAVTLEVTSFGAALPIGCSDTPDGARRNRRVELWVDQEPNKP